MKKNKVQKNTINIYNIEINTDNKVIDNSNVIRLDKNLLQEIENFDRSKDILSQLFYSIEKKVI